MNLKAIPAHPMLEVKFCSTKTLTKKWQNKFLLAFGFLYWYWLQVCSYGLMWTQPVQARWLRWIRIWRTWMVYVYREWKPILSVFVKNTASVNSNLRGYITRDRLSLFSSRKEIKNRLSARLANARERMTSGFFTFWQNKRLRWAFYLLLLVSPAIKFFYLLVPKPDDHVFFLSTLFASPNAFFSAHFDIEVWVNLRSYLFLNGELLAPAVALFGMFLLFPKRYYPAYLLGVPFGYYLSVSVYRLFFISSADEFFTSFGWPVTLLFLLVGIFILMLADRLLFRSQDAQRARQARIIGIINTPGVDWRSKEKPIKEEVEKLLRSNNELYHKDEKDTK